MNDGIILWKNDPLKWRAFPVIWDLAFPTHKLLKFSAVLGVLSAYSLYNILNYLEYQSSCGFGINVNIKKHNWIFYGTKCEFKKFSKHY